MTASTPNRDQVTLSARTIHNPADARHFMRLRPVAAHVQVKAGETMLAESDGAVRLLEVGKDVYEPVLYFPEADIVARLEPVAEKRTYCPLKGHAAYFEAATPNGPVTAWTYAQALPFAAALSGLVAFHAHGLTFIEHVPEA